MPPLKGEITSGCNADDAMLILKQSLLQLCFLLLHLLLGVWNQTDFMKQIQFVRAFVRFLDFSISKHVNNHSHSPEPLTEYRETENASDLTFPWIQELTFYSAVSQVRRVMCNSSKRKANIHWKVFFKNRKWIIYLQITNV